MSRAFKGFGLIEVMLAMSLGVLISLGLVQLLLGAKQTHVSQNASARVQEDARFILSKIIQEIRMVGLFGCLASIEDATGRGDFLEARNVPIRWDADTQQLTLITVDVGVSEDRPNWLLHSDCRSSATAYAGAGAPVPAEGQWQWPIRKMLYSYRPSDQNLTLDGQGIIANVSAFSVLFGVADQAADVSVARYSADPLDPGLIRSVRLSLTLTDPTHSVRAQTFNVVATLRNRFGEGVR